MRRQAEQPSGRRVEQHLVDGGYLRKDDIQQAHAHGVELFVPPKGAKNPGNWGRELEPKAGDSEAVLRWKRRMARPILTVVIEDAPGGHLKWSHRGQGAQGPVGVFQFAVPRKISHYTWNDANSLFSVGIGELQQPTAFHREIAVDPLTGVILRLVMEADREPGSPRIWADIMVEYGPVEIGGKTYFCPVRSVSLIFQSLYLGHQADSWPRDDHAQRCGLW
jgi:hypothetical protein